MTDSDLRFAITSRAPRGIMFDDQSILDTAIVQSQAGTLSMTREDLVAFAHRHGLEIPLEWGQATTPPDRAALLAADKAALRERVKARMEAARPRPLPNF